MNILSMIQQRQSELSGEMQSIPEHVPEMLLIGCVDARKDIISDLGIPKGKSLVLRNVAALVHPEAERRLTESAALAFAVRHMKVKHIVVMGHTDCGGIRAAIQGISSYSLRDYLEPITTIRNQVCAKTEDSTSQLRLLEQEAVKYSLRSLRTYDYIAAAEDAGEVSLHGWVLDIASGRLHVWNEATDSYAPMAYPGSPIS